MPSKSVHDDELTVTIVSTIESSRTTYKVPKKVCFSLDSNQAFTPIYNMEKKDIRRTWYTRRELSEIRKSITFIVCTMARGVRVEENNHETVRGLEHRSRQGRLRRRHMNYEAIHAVLDEQRRQRLQGEKNDSLLADACCTISFKCQRKAYAMGQKDESQIKRRLEDVRRRFDNETSADSKSNTHSPLDMAVMFNCDYFPHQASVPIHCSAA
jgi:hypothetical protein